MQKVIEGTGNIHRLTVAAVVNDIPVEKVVDGAKQINYKPRNQEQINKLEIILKNALGINEIRKDNFSIVSMPFEQNTPEKFDFSNEPAAPQGFNFYNTDKWINLTLILVAIIASLLILRSLLQKIKKEKPLVGNYPETSISENVEMTPALETGSSAPQLPAPKKKKWTLPVGDLEDEISDEAMLKRNQQDKIANYVSKNPVDAAKLINAWLHENE
jgi:flagellar M-ring protein FliF